MSNSTRDTIGYCRPTYSKEFVYYEACKQPRNAIGQFEQRDKRLMSGYTGFTECDSILVFTNNKQTTDRRRQT